MNVPPLPSGDAPLLQRIAQHDRQALARLYDRYARALYSTVIRILGNPDEAADVLQDVFVEIWEKAAAYDPGLGQPFHWALTMSRHKAIDRLRALRRRYSFIEEVTQEMDEQSRGVAIGADEVFPQDQSALIRTAMAALPLEQRQAIELAFLGGLIQNEIAASVHQPLGTIKARIRRGLLTLRDSLRGII